MFGSINLERKLKEGRLEKMIAAAMEVIYRDEKNHYKEAARESAQAVRSKSDLARMQRAIHAVSLQRIYMRNEMFKEPLSREEVARRVSL
jgi:hypothetical protein